MKIIITESQYKLILENEEYLGQIMDFIETFDEDNINLAFQIAKGLKIKQSTILEQYKELFTLFNYKPSVINLKKITSCSSLDIKNNLSKKQLELIFKLPKIDRLFFKKINDGVLDDLVSTNKGLYFTYTCEITSLPKLEEVWENLATHYSNINSLPKLKKVEGDLDLNYTKIESLPNLISVGGDLNLRRTPHGEKFISKMSED